MIPNVRKDTLLPIIRQKVVPDSIVYTDPYPAYDVLDVSEFHHHRIDHSDAYVSIATITYNGIENFWNQAKRTLSRYNGIPKAHFQLFLKETEFASTTENPASNCERSNAGPNSRPSQSIWGSPISFERGAYHHSRGRLEAFSRVTSGACESRREWCIWLLRSSPGTSWTPPITASLARLG
jgi:transposase-like protein